MAKITLIGMYNYDNTIFDYLTLPEGIDKETLVDNILIKSGDFEIIYPDRDFLKMSIGAWSRKWQPTFERWQNVLSIEYDPLENYDRQETWTDNRTMAGTASGQTSGTGSGTSSGTTSGTTGSTTTNKVSAYDSGNILTTKDQTEVSGTDSTTNSGQSSTQTSGSHSDTHNDSDNLTHSGRVHGNIGVTTSQMMLTSELELGYWNIYEKITDIFLTEFVLPIY